MNAPDGIPNDQPRTRHTTPDEWCAVCNHSPAYHDGQGVRPCRAWNPDTTDAKCSCAGWKDKTAPAPVEQKPWGHERADLQGE